ncbi:MAG: hypothetical protein ACYDHH_25775 [Solirubrobacteraceae bacterium]
MSTTSGSKVSRRMRYIFRALLPGGLGFAVAVLVAACGGGSGLLSSAQGTSLNNQLNAVANDINSGRCSAAATDAQAFDQAVTNLSGVTAPLVNNLKQASQPLASKAGPACQQSASVPTTTTTPKTVTTPTITTKPKTTPTNTTTTSTSPTTTTGSTSTSPATTGTGAGTSTSGGAGLTGSRTGTGTGGSGGASAGGGNGNGNGQ